MTNELELIRDHHDSRPGPAPEVTARAWMLLVEEAERAKSGQARPAPMPRRPPRALLGGRFALRTGVAVGLAAAVTAGLALVGGDQAGTPFGAPPASAAELLRQAASVATREDVRPGPGQFVHVVQQDVTFGSGSQGDYTQDVRREVWMPDGDRAKALTRSTYGKTHVISGSGPQHVQSPGTVEYERAGQCGGRSLALPFPVADLSGDPDQALAKVRRNAEAFVRSDQRRRGETNLGADEIGMRVQKVIASTLLGAAQDPLTPSPTRATVFGVLSKMPTATIVPELTDSAGRHGVGASVRFDTPGGWERAELIFEPGTYRFLGYQGYIGQQEDGQAKETPTSGTAVMSVKVVDSMPEVPKDAPEPMFC